MCMIALLVLVYNKLLQFLTCKVTLNAVQSSNLFLNVVTSKYKKFLFTYVHTYISTYIQVHTRIYICIYMYIHAYMYVYA